MLEGPTRAEEMLARLAELDLLAAEKAYAKLMASEETSEIADLARTYQRMARSCRQTILAKARLVREREGVAERRARAERWDEIIRPPHRSFEPALPPQARPGRLEAIRAAVRPIIEREAAEREDVDELNEELEAFLEIIVAEEDWRAPLEEHIRGACMALGIDGSLGPRYADEEVDDDEVDDEEARDGRAPPVQDSA